MPNTSKSSKKTRPQLPPPLNRIHRYLHPALSQRRRARSRAAEEVSGRRRGADLRVDWTPGRRLSASFPVTPPTFFFDLAEPGRSDLRRNPEERHRPGGRADASR